MVSTRVTCTIILVPVGGLLGRDTTHFNLGVIVSCCTVSFVAIECRAFITYEQILREIVFAMKPAPGNNPLL